MAIEQFICQIRNNEKKEDHGKENTRATPGTSASFYNKCKTAG
jgi:hypothetical protein